MSGARHVVGRGGGTHGGYLEGVVGSSVVNVVAEAGEEESEDLQVGQEGEVIAALVEHIAEMGHGECVVPIMIGWVPVATFHHQNKPGRQKQESIHVIIFSVLLTWQEHLVAVSISERCPWQHTCLSLPVVRINRRLM